jgi:hypothetical protein
MQTSLGVALGKGAIEDGPDAEVKEFRFDKLEARLGTIQPGAEQDYFAGVLANRAGRVAESIRLLTNALPSIRTSRPDRAAVALETLADDYSKSFRYNAGIDELYGNLGQDVVAKFESFTLDFSTMTFSLGQPLSRKAGH